MDEAVFEVEKLRRMLAIHEEALADLIANGASEEAVREVKQRRDNYAQCIGMMAGPAQQKKRRFDAW